MEDNTYNGWTNRATWAYYSWFADNYNEERVREILLDCEDISDEDSRVLALSDYLEVDLNERVEELNLPDWLEDIFFTSDSINFEEVAENILSNINFEKKE